MSVTGVETQIARWKHQMKEPNSERAMETAISLASQTFHSANGEEKSGNLPIPFWFAVFRVM